MMLELYLLLRFMRLHSPNVEVPSGIPSCLCCQTPICITGSVHGLYTLHIPVLLNYSLFQS